MTREELLTFQANLRNADLASDSLFRDLLEEGIYFLDLTNAEIAREFGASRPTILRWRSGANAPHPAMRKAVYEWLDKRVSAL